MNLIGKEVDWFRHLLNFLLVINRIHSWSDYVKNSKGKSVVEFLEKDKKNLQGTLIVA